MDAKGYEAWHLRWDREDQKFTWAQDQDGQHPGRGSCRPDLYQRETVANASSVILCEGERDADTLNAWLTEQGEYPGIVATTTANGANDVKLEFLGLLHGKARVVVSGDNDKSGNGYAQQCATLLHGKVSALHRLCVPDAYHD